MKEAKHIAINEAKWDRWASNLDKKSKRNDYLRKAQKELVDLLELNKDSRILDIGCGTGQALGYAVQRNQGSGEYFGVDLSEKMIGKAKENFPQEERFHFLVANSESIPLENHYFDIIICTNSFHHYLHPQKSVNEMFRLLKPGGKVYILDPTTDKIMMKFIDKLLKLFDRTHVKMHSTQEFKNMFSAAGIKYISNQSILGPVLVHVGEKG